MNIIVKKINQLDESITEYMGTTSYVEEEHLMKILFDEIQNFPLAHNTLLTLRSFCMSIEMLLTDSFVPIEDRYQEHEVDIIFLIDEMYYMGYGFAYDYAIQVKEIPFA